MKYPISGSVMSGVVIRKGNHEYEDGKPEVIELNFQGYSSTYVQVIDIETAHELLAQLKNVLGQK